MFFLHFIEYLTLTTGGVSVARLLWNAVRLRKIKCYSHPLVPTALTPGTVTAAGVTHHQGKRCTINALISYTWGTLLVSIFS